MPLRELELLLQDPKKVVPSLLKQSRKSRVLLLLRPHLKKERKAVEKEMRKLKRAKKATPKREKVGLERRVRKKKKRSRL